VDDSGKNRDKNTEQALLVRKKDFDKVLGKLIQAKPVKRGTVKAIHKKAD
jgi:hypothetical protein